MIRMMKNLAVAAILFLAASSAWADGESGLLNPAEYPVQEEVQYELADFDITLTMLGRASSLGGDVEPDLALSYRDLFDSGAGIVFEGAFLWHMNPFWKFGPYASIGWNAYGGERFVDAIGDSLEADNLYTFDFLVGAEGQYAFGPHFHFDLHAAIGVVSYSKVDGILTLSGTPQGVEIFEETSVLAFDFGARLGLDITRFFFLEAGFGLRAQGAPAEADFDFAPDPPTMAAFEFGGGFRF
jgi:hypothetical protein